MITQNSPVTYVAPDSLPDPTTVVVRAVSREDAAHADTCHIHLRFTKIFVDASSGSDDTGTGSTNIPVKTITRGLELAEAGMTVLVRPGVYDKANGEIFELVLPEGVALVGMDWETCVIRDHGDGSYFEQVKMQANGSSFRKFTLELGEPADPNWDIAVRVRGDNQLVDSIRISERADYSVMRVSSTENTVIQNCHFVVADGSRWDRGYEITANNVGLIMRNCTISGFHAAVFINGFQTPLIEGCLLAGNRYGVDLWYEPPGNDPNPDLGGGARGSTGGNTFTDYTGCGIQNPTTNAIYAKFNTWDNDPPIEGVDFCNTGTGSVVTE
jgi:hypothetical protein